MYRFGERQQQSHGHHFFVLVGIFLLCIGILAGAGWYIYKHATTTIDQAAPSTQNFVPENKKENIKVDTALYAMELPADWKQKSVNKDDRYTSIEWELQTGGKNRWITIYTDRVPIDMAFNSILAVTTTKNTIATLTKSENCSKFTPKQTEGNLKVLSKWQDAAFLCDLSNTNDNAIGVSSAEMGTSIKLTGPTQGTHTYLFHYLDRGVPEDTNPLMVAVHSFRPK